jgi:hypothetical protein
MVWIGWFGLDGLDWMVWFGFVLAFCFLPFSF